MKNLSTVFDYFGCGFSWVVYAINENEYLQTILFVLSLLSTIIVFLKSFIPLVIRFVHWCKSSFNDGKIDEEEQKELDEIFREMQGSLEEIEHTMGKDKK